ncbi:MAG TPA: SH3 domain-containing protein [Chloroflexota bacterium]
MRRRDLLQATATLGAAVLTAGVTRVFADSGLGVGTLASVAIDGLHVRGGPGADQPLVASLDAGTLVELLGVSTDGRWWRIASEASVGYVSAEYLTATGQPSGSTIFDLDLDLAYAPQLSPIWCDPADIQMWLGYHGGGGEVPASTLQSSIWDWETTHNAGFTVDQWDCSPYAVASAAQHWMPGLGFDHFAYDDPLDGSRLLAWLLASPAFREPSIALVWRGLHYILVRGVRSVGDPARDPAATQLLGFYVSDPDRRADFWLGQDRFIPIDRWLNELFTPVSYRTPHTGVPGDIWQDRLVAIQRSASASGPTDAGRRNASPADYA